MSRILLILFAIPVLLVIAAALFIPLVLDDQKVLNLAADALQKETGATLTVDGEVNLSILPRISVNLGDVGIAMPGDQEESIQARSVGIGVALWPLFSGAVEVGEIAVDGLTMTLKSAPEQPALDTSELSDEQLDAYYAKRRKEMEEAGAGAAQGEVAAATLALNVQRLLVTDSVLETVSAESGERSRVEIISLEATGLNLDDRMMPVTATVRVEAGEGVSPINVALEAGVRMDASSQQLTLDALAVDVTGLLEEAVSVKANGVVDLIKQAADLQLELLVGETRGEGKVRYASFETPQIDADLHLNLFDPALLALAGLEASTADAAAADAGAARAAAADAGAAPARVESVSGAEPAIEGAVAEGDRPLPLAAIRAIDTRARLQIDQARFQGHVVEKMRVKLRAVDGIVQIPSLTGKLHGGELEMKAKFDGQHNIAKLNTQGGLKGVNIAQALKAMESEPIATGTADLNWRLNSSGSTSNQLVEAMKGPIDLLTSEVTLQDLGIEKMLCQAVALANQESLTQDFPDSTRFETLSANLRMNGGKLRMKPLRAELAEVKLNGEGAMDILKQDFSATITATLSEGMAELDPACRINERLAGIGWPVNCNGSLTGDPADWCGVDSQEIIEQMATKEVKRQIEKEAGKLLDKLFR